MASDNEELKKRIGNYLVTIHPRIGGGTFGQVYKAVNVQTNQSAAAKEIVLNDSGEVNKTRKEMAIRELDVIRSLDGHKHIVRLIDYKIDSYSCVLFLEYCDLGDLGAYLSRAAHRLDFPAKLKLMHEIASAIEFMHTRDPPIIHRDIKPQNILVKLEHGEEVVKVTDFGLAKLLESNTSFSALFRPGQVMSTTCGAQYYMAPEFYAELEGGPQYTSSVDVFSLGLLFAVILQFQEDNQELLPLSVDAKRKGKFVSIGYEMVIRCREKQNLPVVMAIEAGDSLVIKRIKRIILNMTRFRSTERKFISDVVEECSELQEQIAVFGAQQTDSTSDTASTQDLRSPADHHDIRFMRKGGAHIETGHNAADSGPAKRVINFSLKDYTKHHYSVQKVYTYDQKPWRLTANGNQLWTVRQDGDIDILQSKSDGTVAFIRNITIHDSSFRPGASDIVEYKAWAVHPTSYFTVAACWGVIEKSQPPNISRHLSHPDIGLAVIDETGLILDVIAKGKYIHVVNEHKTVYGLVLSKDRVTVHRQQSQQWLCVREIKLPHQSYRFCVSNNILTFSLYEPQSIMKYHLTTNQVSHYGGPGKHIGQFYWPRVCERDNEGNVLIGDRGNRRLQILLSDNTWKLVTITSKLEDPRDATIDCHGHLYVINESTKTLIRLVQ